MDGTNHLQLRNEAMSDKVLLIDDDATLCRVLEFTLQKAGYRVASAISAKAGLDLFLQYRPALIIADIQMPELTGFQLLKELKKIDQNALVIFMSGYSSIADAVAAIKAGAYDYLPKPFSNGQLFLTIKQALGYRQAKKFPSEASKSVCIVGHSQVMQNLTQRVEKAAKSQASILLCGESGTGKEVIARALHQKSARANQPFIAINCAAIPKDLLEAELFGHVKGAFTHAAKNRQGKFGLANMGTLFLDEIGELPLNLQPKLLRALQEREIEPIGGTPEKIDVRIIAATNRDIEKEMEQGAFREDLYYRLAVIPFVLPPLRERKEDIPLLINFFLRKKNAAKVEFSAHALETLLNYSWPGNVRQLENIIEQVVTLSSSSLIKVEDLPPHIAQRRLYDNSIFRLPKEGYSLESLEREAILQALYLCKGNKSKTAKILHISRHALNYRLGKHKL